jgi:hypothetical protein
MRWWRKEMDDGDVHYTDHQGDCTCNGHHTYADVTVEAAEAEVED